MSTSGANKHTYSSSSYREQYASPEIVEEGLGHISQDLNTGHSSFSSSTHSTSTQGTISLLSVYNPSQLEVMLPMSSLSSIIHEKSVHSTATRLKSGAITKRSYTCFTASFLELQTSLLDDT